MLNVAWFMIAGDKSAEVFVTKVWFSGIVLPSINFQMTNVFFIAIAILHYNSTMVLRRLSGSTPEGAASVPICRAICPHSLLSHGAPLAQ